MIDEEPEEAASVSDTNGPPDQPIYWHHCPTIFTDGILATARAGGMHRFVLGEWVFNVDEGATAPAMRPVANLVISYDALKHMIAEMEKYAKAADE